MYSIKKLTATLLTVILLSACGGGGSSTSQQNNPAPQTPPIATNTTTDTVITGMASKGPIDGTAAIYAISADGSKGALLMGNVPVVKGSYSANIGKYAMPVLIEVTGTYTDEATGTTIVLGSPLRAAIANASGTITAAVTPLTELAVQKAGTLTASSIDTSNKLISGIFKVDNIITTQPVDPATAISAASANQKDYTLALAAISQLSLTRGGEPLTTTLASVAGSISSNGMNSQTVTNFQKAVTDFIASAKNFTGINDIAATGLNNINGNSTASYTLALQGSFAVNAIKGIQLEVVIPPGLTLRSDATNGATLSGVVAASPATTAAAASLLSWYNTSDGVLHLGMTTSKGIGVGDLATITCDVVPGWTKPAASAFTVRNIKAVDGTTATINGITVSVK
jgi:hypothetical protein